MDCYRYCLTSLAFSDFTFWAGDYTRCSIKHEFPSTGYTIVANDIGCPIVAKEFKIAMIRGQPAIQHLYDLNFIVGQDDKARRFFAPISGVTVYVDLYDRLKSFYAFLSAMYFGGLDNRKKKLSAQ